MNNNDEDEDDFGYGEDDRTFTPKGCGVILLAAILVWLYLIFAPQIASFVRGLTN